jgi:cysteine desulfurase
VIPSSHPIYLDYHATTPVDLRVADHVYQAMTLEFGNASSIDHEYGDLAEAAVNQATKHLANLVEASPREIIWTSGATESINLAIQGSLPPNPVKPYRIALLPLEHKAILDTCQIYERRGWAELIYLEVDSQGRPNLDRIDRVCAQGLSLLCVMAANNEIGNIYPIDRIGRIAQKYQIPLLCDASQAVGKIEIDFSNWGITFMAISGHKLYAPKGIGALVVRKGTQIQPQVFGGGHQRGLRSGTLNVPGIVGLGEACRLRQSEMMVDEIGIAAKRDRLQSLLSTSISNLVINGDLEHRLAGNLHISIPGVPNSAVISRIRHQLAISTGSACSSGVEAPSHVLRALQLPDDLVTGALRIGIGKFTTDNEIDRSAEILIDCIRAIKRSIDRH